MTERISLDDLNSDQLDALYDQLDTLRASEELGYTEGIVPTPGQWIWRWNRLRPEERLGVAATVIGAGQQASRCFTEDHEARLARAEAAVARIRTQHMSGTNGLCQYCELGHWPCPIICTLDGPPCGPDCQEWHSTTAATEPAKPHTGRNLQDIAEEIRRYPWGWTVDLNTVDVIADFIAARPTSA